MRWATWSSNILHDIVEFFLKNFKKIKFIEASIYSFMENSKLQQQKLNC